MPFQAEICISISNHSHYLDTRVATQAEAHELAEQPGTRLTRVRFGHREIRVEVTRDERTFTTLFLIEDHFPELHGAADCAALAGMLVRDLAELTGTIAIVPSWLTGSPQAAASIAQSVRRMRELLATLPAIPGAEAPDVAGEATKDKSEAEGDDDE